MKNLLSVAALLALVFAAGVASASSILGIGRLFQGDVSVRCVEGRACVGDTVDNFLLSYADDRGGLTGVFCTATPADRQAHRDAAYFFLREIVQGRTCPSANYSLEFRNPSTRTLVRIENGTVTKIELGPLHVIDL